MRDREYGALTLSILANIQRSFFSPAPCLWVLHWICLGGFSLLMGFNQANAKSNVIGTTFHDLSSMISLVHDKSRVRICLDTCHLFAAGYDIRTAESYANVMRDFDREVGNGFLGGMHLNDSKADLGACKDLHENIGLSVSSSFLFPLPPAKLSVLDLYCVHHS